MKFCGGGVLSEIENPQDEDPTKNNADTVDVTFDFNMGDTSTTRSVNYFNFSEIKLIEDSMSNYTKATATAKSTISFNARKINSSNTFNNVKIQKFVDLGLDYLGDFHSEEAIAGKTYSWNFEVDSSYKSLRIGFNGGLTDGCFYYSTAGLANGKYTFSFRLSAFDAYGTCTMTDFAITKDENTAMDSQITVPSEGTTMGNLYVPTPTRTGYTFDGWYKKKNYITESVMDDFMQELNSVNVPDGKIEKSGNIYSWCGWSDQVPGVSGDYVFHTGIYLTGTYRLTYDAYCSDPECSTSNRSTSLNMSGHAAPEYVSSTTWKTYSCTGTYSNEELVLDPGWEHGQRSYFKNIRLERIDTDDFEGDAYKQGTSLSFGISDKATLYAKWTEITYTLSVTLDSSSAWSEEPEVYVSAFNTEGTLTRGSTWTVTVPYSKFTYDEFVTLAIASENYEKYVVLFQSKPTVESPYATAFSWRQRTNLTLTAYVFQKYTISFGMGYAEPTPPPDPVYKIHGTKANLPYNYMAKSGFSPNGWNTQPDGSGTSYTTSYNVNADVTLYPNYTPDHYYSTLHIVTYDKHGEVSQTPGGTVSADITFGKNNQYYHETKTITDGESFISNLGGYDYTRITATPNEGYVVYKIEGPDNERWGLPEDVTVYFQQISDNVLKYDRDEQYWYFEDGMYPQSEVDSDLAATLDSQSFSVAEYTLSYNNGTEQTVNVYTYDGKQYALVEVNEVRKWFAVEPIRWRVSEYGVGEDAKPDLWQYYGDTKSLVAVSEKILFASIMTADRIDDSKVTESKDFWLNNYVTTNDFKMTYDSDFSHNQDSFAGAGGQDVSQSGTVSTKVAVYSNCDTTLSSSAKLTAFASFLLYGTTAYADTYDAYWTRDLEADGRSEYGCGVVVTSYGSETLRWLNQMCGVRLSYYCTEVSRY